MNKKRAKKNNIYAVAITIAVLLLVVYIIPKGGNEPIANQTESTDIKFNKQGTLDFLSADNNDVLSTIDVEVADNVTLRARGLMYRKSIPDNSGMIFIFDIEDYQGFWMKNTYIALDILFVNANKEIVTIHTNTTPMSDRNYESTKPAMYVVEVNAGYCIKNNIKEGDIINFTIDK